MRGEHFPVAHRSRALDGHCLETCRMMSTEQWRRMNHRKQKKQSAFFDELLFGLCLCAGASLDSPAEERTPATFSRINTQRSSAFYCDYCDTYLTHDSPSVRKTHCSGRKHKENVKDYYQKWMEEQAQSLIDKTTAAFQQGKIPPTPFPGGPPPGGPPRPGMLPTPPMGGPPMMPMMGPPPHGMMPGGPDKQTPPPPPGGRVTQKAVLCTAGPKGPIDEAEKEREAYGEEDDCRLIILLMRKQVGLRLTTGQIPAQIHTL
ncbi:hypothetical protein F2P81_012386 [Scophthalmus maximus]|uniref:U1 small nuclear ribonucleoprotein C n=1 Tax=Scophthalmus maximus TaxID=52904 RepID=A0A6A4SR81_SCOMX|nr:hypothetical protein F2P81_012386 [Scophthalmus maximus]